MKLSKEEKKHLLKYLNVKIKKNPLTHMYYWAHYDTIVDNKWFTSDGYEYISRNEAINAFLKRAISPA